MLALIRKDGSSLSIPEQRYHEWKADFPGLDIKEEIQKANNWMSRQPKAKSWKTLAGFKGWLKRAYENSPRVGADKKTSGQLPHRERVQRENDERTAAKAQIPRPSEERVTEMCRQLRESLPEYHRPESKRIDWLRHDHVFTKAYYGGLDWCEGCGMWKDQWRPV